MTGIRKAIEAAGGEVALADLCGVTQQAVSKWKQRGYVPLRPVDRATQITNMFRIERKELIDPALLDAVEGGQ